MDPLAVLGLVFAPVLQWWKVVVLSVDINAIVFDQPAHMVGEPLAAFRIAQVEQAVFIPLLPQQPFWMFHIEPGARLHPFRFKPEQQVGALPGDPVGYRLQAMGESFGVRSSACAPKPTKIGWANRVTRRWVSRSAFWCASGM